ncbi:hypothetical protein, partial [Sporosarcina sp. NCCP-2222]|uniref:hypothetical protein n=1 Tax=Sporosarcina sp. NCCP-2222 TaxID=2935073 RepID=UPI0020BD4D9B
QSLVSQVLSPSNSHPRLLHLNIRPYNRKKVFVPRETFFEKVFPMRTPTDFQQKRQTELFFRLPFYSSQLDDWPYYE